MGYIKAAPVVSIKMSGVNRSIHSMPIDSNNSNSSNNISNDDSNDNYLQ